MILQENLKSKKTKKKIFSLAFLATAGFGVFSISNPAHALTWNWSFSATNANAWPPSTVSGAGTFSTASTTPQVGFTETITGITGTYTDLNGSTYAIDSLSNFQSANNTFQWDGSSNSSILTDDFGISFRYNDGSTNQDVNFYMAGMSGIFGAINTSAESSGGNFQVITSSLNPVPGPIPVLGATAAFGWSRRLRRKTKRVAIEKTASKALLPHA